jgi:outer membrane biosynthesis protein TonB
VTLLIALAVFTALVVLYVAWPALRPRPPLEAAKDVPAPAEPSPAASEEAETPESLATTEKPPALAEPEPEPTAPAAEPTPPAPEPVRVSSVPTPIPEPAPASARPTPPPETPPPPAPPPTPAPPPSLELELEPVVAPKPAPAPAPAPSAQASLESSDPQHRSARKLARLAVSEIKLYNEKLVTEGRGAGNLYATLKDPIDQALALFERRVPKEVRASFDYVHDELVRQLAGGDASKLGPGYPGAASLDGRVVPRS